MRLLYVVQRYGHEVAGGAELHCRQFATRLAERGHDVEVLTSCAMNYTDWANDYPAGTTELDGVSVHRLPAAARRDDRFFGPMNARAVYGHKPVPLFLQAEWMRMQGPWLPDLAPWLEDRTAEFDAVIFFTYLYYPTWAGLPVASGLAPTVLHPTAHDEPPLYLPLFDPTFAHPWAFAFSTPEERDLARRRFGITQRTSIIGIGFDTSADRSASGARFRSAYGLDDSPYLLFVGRLDPAKGSDELFEFFTLYRRRNPSSPLKLVVVGDPVKPLPAHPDLVVTGFVDEQTKHDAYAGATVFCQPSYFESFSMVLAEAWVHRLPALVQGRCEVVVGQSRRSGGGLPYLDFAEFEAGLDMVLGNEKLALAMGQSGRAYVDENYQWDVVLSRYEKLLVDAPRRARRA
jgi:glycosyltransferase involved in cell wall biosynthesis